MFEFKVLAIVPSFNEVAHIGDILKQLLVETEELNMRIAVVDGGSTDGTVQIVSRLAEQHPQILLLNNPKRIQSAAINLAMASLGSDVKYLVRIDAHGKYPSNYCRELVEEAERTKADGVVVCMESEGHSRFERIAAAAQNSLIGNGGSAHRNLSEGQWIDHGHHALMRATAFCAVGGYDETFSHNEDAELDLRLTQAGFKLWLTSRCRMKYFPRSSANSLFRQYLNYGRGRARTFLKHSTTPKLRQLVPAPLVPLVILSLIPGLRWISAALLIWAAACILYGFYIAVLTRSVLNAFSGLCAMTMHLAWSTGFWIELGAHFYKRIGQRVMSIGHILKAKST